MLQGIEATMKCTFVKWVNETVHWWTVIEFTTFNWRTAKHGRWGILVTQTIMFFPVFKELALMKSWKPIGVTFDTTALI